MIEDITGNVTLFGNLFGIALSQLILILCVAVLLLLFVLEIEFRQVRKVAKKMDNEEISLTRDLRELRDSVRELATVLKEDFGIETDADKASAGEAEGGSVQRSPV
jgi:predicted Holliday junction resolvase-like endonuclease